MFTEDLDPFAKTGHPCPRAGCPCTHNDDCDRGWINTEHADGKVTVSPCSVCDPDRAAVFRMARNRHDLMQALQNRSKSKRAEAYEREEGSRTRTL